MREKRPWNPFARKGDLSAPSATDLTQLEKRLMNIVQRLNEQVDAAVARLAGLEQRIMELNAEVLVLRGDFAALTEGVANAADKLDAAVPDAGGSMGGITR